MVSSFKDAERRKQEVADLTQNNSIGDEKPKKKRATKDPMWKWMADGLKVFKVQLEKSNETKLRCIENQVLGKTNDLGKFWGDFMEKTELLLNRRKFTAECEEFDICPLNLAEHIIPMGGTVINKVNKEGISAVLGNDIEFYKDRLSPKEANPFRKKLSKLIGMDDKGEKNPNTYQGRVKNTPEITRKTTE